MNRIRHNIVYFAADAQYKSRREMMAARQDHNLMLRLAMVGVYKALRGSVIESLGRSVGGEFLGMGGEQIVYRTTKGQVKKVLRNSVSLDADQVEMMVERNQQLTDSAARHMNPQWVETAFKTIKMPALIGGYAAVATQPEIMPTIRFRDGTAIVDYDGDEEFTEELGKFVAGVSDLKASTGMYPDLIGPNNVVLARSSGAARIQVLDTLPVPPERLSELSGDGRRTHGDIHAEIMAKMQDRYDNLIQSTGSRVLALS